MEEPRISGIFSRMRSTKSCALRFEAAAERWLGAAALACVPLGCGGEPESERAEPSASMWVGEVSGTDVKVALAQRGGASELFFCGGDDSYTSSTKWFQNGALHTAPFSFTEGGWSVAGVIEEGTVSGSVQIEADISRGWTAEPTDPRTLAGLYDGVAPCGRLGLIVTQPTVDDEPTGQGACLRFVNGGSFVEQVNPVRLALTSTRELLVTVPSAPDEPFTVRPVAGAER
jgi:hypothetical protein